MTPGVLWERDHHVETSDGARIAYTVLGPADGPVVALCAGFLCPDTWWRFLATALADAGYRVVVTGYRGIAGSSQPARAGAHSYTVARFAGDVLDVLDAEGVDTFAAVGHSMGTQVMLEAYRQASVRVTALASVTGPYESPLRSLWGRGSLALAVYEPLRLGAALTLPPVLRLLWRTGTHLPLLPVGRLLGVLGPRATDELVSSYLAHAGTLDIGVVRRVAAGMHAHSAADLLPEVAAPTLVVIGARDPWSPPSIGRHMAAVMPRATLRIAPHGTHGTVLEYPELVNGWVLDHLARHVPAATRAPRPQAGRRRGIVGARG